MPTFPLRAAASEAGNPCRRRPGARCRSPRPDPWSHHERFPCPDRPLGCHTHIYGPWARFPLPANAAYTPAPAPFSELLALHRRLGISHGVLVQAAPYGTDHSAILAAIAESDGHYRGVGLIDQDTSDAQLQALHDGGLRGIRFNLMGHLPGARDPQQLRRLAERVAPLGWHVLIHGELRPCCRSWNSGAPCRCRW